MALIIARGLIVIVIANGFPAHDAAEGVTEYVTVLAELMLAFSVNVAEKNDGLPVLPGTGNGDTSFTN